MSKLNATQVLNYLSEHPDFLVQHPELLEQINLAVEPEGVTSLVKRQQALLREKNQQLKTQLCDVITTATSNEQIFKAFSSCQRLLVNCTPFNEVSPQICRQLKSQLGLSECHIHLYQSEHDALIRSKLIAKGHFLGRLNEPEQTLLFEKPSQSAAIYLIGSVKHPVAIFAFASDDPLHYQPEQSSLFVMEFIKLLELKMQR